jgi:hypothetical protein
VQLLEESATPSQVQQEVQGSLLGMRWGVSGRELKMGRTELQRELKMLDNGGKPGMILSRHLVTIGSISDLI